jgi:NAD(P)-dependent dehydrogenase (short-subunit alcohol dehydrogenase family)
MIPRTFLVTGASKGIGRALSNQLAEAGHQVVGIARDAGDPDFPGRLIVTCSPEMCPEMSRVRPARSRTHEAQQVQ